MGLELLSSNRCFAGEQRRYQAISEALSGDTVFPYSCPTLLYLTRCQSSFICQD